MQKQVRYKTFSELIQKYRERRGLNVSDIHRMLQAKYYWDDVKYPTVVKYDSGERTPHPRYVMTMKYCLKLTDEEFQSLIDGIIGDYTAALYDSYRKEEERLRDDDLI